ncbi:MAG: hypothetical protein KDD10_18715, partial [Phaeodactylibacter sp.]|nr:hypothetical protein [Phaeodactylibacter sp.]
WTALENLKPGDRIAASSWGDHPDRNPTAHVPNNIQKNRQDVAIMPLSTAQDRPEDVLALEAPSHPAIFWDEITSILPLGEEDVYDATVEGVHNFVANDIIVHNSIEQDADIVAFIYRPEYYDILEDEEGQSLKGIAEVIVAKHRHGALKTIKLRFTDEFARFSDLDDPDFGALPEDTFQSPQSNIITRPSKMNDDEDIPF